MRILVIGNGAREHALAARLAADPSRPDLICAPGNPGMTAFAAIAPIPAAIPPDIDRLADFARRERVDFTVVGPELPLSLGIVDRFAAAGHRIFGPTAAAARLESSKAFAKAFMARHGVPTARFQTCDSAPAALEVVRHGELGWPVVLKADGLAAGKGVVVADDVDAATQMITASMQAGKFGEAGARLVIEECLTGPEVSFFALCDGTRALSLGSAQDHKRIFDDDRGPNTGGMGAFAPTPLVGPVLERRIMTDIVEPVLSGMAAEGHPYRGFLYVGLMLTPAGPKVIEFNVRLGDPEAQVILPLVDQPLLPMLEAAAAGRLPGTPLQLSRVPQVGVVIASCGYPESSESGVPIHGVDAAGALPGVMVYHAGTSIHDHQLVTAGGRVLTVVGSGSTFADSISRAYAGVAAIDFAGMQYRRDIGRKALAGWTPNGGLAEPS